jgi:SsrA-binding protein
MAKKEKKGAFTNPTIVNRRARYEYAIEEEIEAGLVLKGSEVKSLRQGKANIQEAYATEKAGEVWLINGHISEYTPANKFNHDPNRPRKLLLKKREVNRLLGLLRIKGLTLVPLKIYFNNKGIAKILLGVGKGKKQYDKREAEKKRDWQRQKEKLMKHSL